MGTQFITIPPSKTNETDRKQQRILEFKNRKVFVLLTRFPDLGSKITSVITNFYYTHASIGLEEDKSTFYSFVTKGFIVENIERYIRPDREPYPCMLYEVEVTNEVYEKIKNTIHTFVAEKKNLKYAKLGVALCIFRISYQSPDSYFCSQFVADILKSSGAVHFEKSSSLFLPKDFDRLDGLRYVFSGNIKSLLHCCSA